MRLNDALNRRLKCRQTLHTSVLFTVSILDVNVSSISFHSQYIVQNRDPRVRTRLENPWKPLNLKSPFSRPWKSLNCSFIHFGPSTTLNFNWGTFKPPKNFGKYQFEANRIKSALRKWKSSIDSQTNFHKDPWKMVALKNKSPLLSEYIYW